MVKLRSPQSGGEVCVPAESVAAFLAAGWRPTEPDAIAVAAPVPPRANASRGEWAAFATANDIPFPEDAKQSEIRALVAAHIA